MTMKPIYFLFFIAFCFGASCGEISEKEKQAYAPGPEDTVYAVRQGPFHFSLRLPKRLVQESMPIILFKENSGDLIISLGESIYLKVSQQIKDIKAIERELSEDATDIYEISKVEESNSELIYKQSLIDDSFGSYHYKAMISRTDLPYFVETDASKMYTLSDIEVIRKIAQSLSPL